MAETSYCGPKRDTKYAHKWSLLMIGAIVALVGTRPGAADFIDDDQESSLLESRLEEARQAADSQLQQQQDTSSEETEPQSQQAQANEAFMTSIRDWANNLGKTSPSLIMPGPVLIQTNESQEDENGSAATPEISSQEFASDSSEEGSSDEDGDFLDAMITQMFGLHNAMRQQEQDMVHRQQSLLSNLFPAGMGNGGQVVIVSDPDVLQLTDPQTDQTAYVPPQEPNRKNKLVLASSQLPADDEMAGAVPSADDEQEVEGGVEGGTVSIVMVPSWRVVEKTVYYVIGRDALTDDQYIHSGANAVSAFIVFSFSFMCVGLIVYLVIRLLRGRRQSSDSRRGGLLSSYLSSPPMYSPATVGATAGGATADKLPEKSPLPPTEHSNV